jgi:hypothetical protein
MTENYLNFFFKGLACRDPDRPAPFEKIASSTSLFIDAEYLPDGIKINDPRSMKLKDMKDFFTHVGNRERCHGIREAFQFKKVLSSRKKGSIRDARYKEVDSEIDHTPAPTTTPISRRSTISQSQERPDTEKEASPTLTLSTISGDEEQGGDKDMEVEPAPGPGHTKQQPNPVGHSTNTYEQQDDDDDDSDTPPAPARSHTKAYNPAPVPATSQSRRRKQEDAPTEGTRKSSRQQNIKLTNTQPAPNEGEREGNLRSSRSKGKRRI